MHVAWINNWSGLTCTEITIELITKLRDDRSKISNQTANKELRHLRSLFNWGIKKGYVADNPASRVEMMRVEKKEIHVPALDDVRKILAVATIDQQEYLNCLQDTFARSREINNLRWQDVDFENKTVTLYTRKKKHGTKAPRVIPMTNNLFNVLTTRNKRNTDSIPWVFWHTYYSRIKGKKVVGPYRDRKKFMRTLCQKAGVEYFRFHPLRHAGASFMESIGVPISHIQEILGHNNRKTTEGYIHSLENNKVEAFQLFEKARSQYKDQSR